MAVKMYYGTCSTAGDYTVKEVFVRDSEIIEGFEFQKGDALSVYFTYGNTVDNISLKIMNDSTGDEISISDDSGKLVKNKSVVLNTIEAWDNGETVIFVYTEEASGSNDNNFYWELVNGAPSTENVYGVTKLEGNANTNISTWLVSESTKDYTSALTPGLLKKFYDALKNDSNLLVQLNWYPEQTGTMLTLGTLRINDDVNNSVAIQYPLESLIEEIVRANVLSTSQILNDGEGNFPNSRVNGHFYLTNILPQTNTALFYENGGRNWVFIDANTEYENLHLRGKKGITLNVDDGNGGMAAIGTGTVSCKPKFIAQSNLQVDGATTAKGITCTGLTLNGSGAVSNNFTVNGTLKGKTLYEDGISLKNKYSGKLKIVDKLVGPITISANSACGHRYLNLREPGWQAIGVVGWNLNYASSNLNDGFQCYIWEALVYVGDQQLMYSMRNTKNAAVTINCNFRILYVKET